ncbi:MAG: carboxypeptidase-like regulatory domain-containing protein [Candidatus Eisenbacteria bacterium]
MLRRVSYILCLTLLGGVHATTSGAGTVAGVVRNGTRDGAVVPFATVVVESTAVGTMSLADSSFRVPDLASGPYRLRCSAIGFRDGVIVDVTVAGAAEETTWVALELTEWGITDEEAAAVSIGADVSATSQDLELRITSDRGAYAPGDLASFVVSVTNRSDEVVHLLDLGEDRLLIRCPRSVLQVEGPSEWQRDGALCWEEPSTARRFVVLRPGDVHSVPLTYGFALGPAGRYEAKFTYSTAVPDVRFWIPAYAESISPEWSKMLRRVPQVTMVDSVTFEVRGAGGEPPPAWGRKRR